MKLHISTYFHFILILCTFFMLFIDIQIGIFYFIATIPLYFFTSRWIKLPRDYIPFFLIAAGSIWAVYLVRPLFLVINPTFFQYPKIGYINNLDQTRALWQVAFYSSIFFLGLYWTVIVKANKRRKLNCNWPGLLVKNKKGIILGAGIIILFDLFLLLSFEVGVSGTYSPIAFIRLFWPLDLIVPILILYLLKYKQFITRFEKTCIFFLIGFTVLISLLQGHKSSFLYLITILFLYYLFEKNNFKIPAIKSFLWGGAIALIMFVSFPMATAIREAMQMGGFSFDIFFIIFKTFKHFNFKEFFLYALNLITGRLSGYDGLLAVNIYKPAELHKIFSKQYILKHAIAALIPRYYVDSMPPGKAVGVYYSGHSLDIMHSGALGLFASIILVSGGVLSFIYILFIGIFFGACFRFTMKFAERPGTRILLSIIFSYQLISWMISGNFDRNIQSFIIVLVHLMFYFSVFWFTYKTCR